MQTRDEISKDIFGKPFKEISMKDCEIVNTKYFSQEGASPYESFEHDKTEFLKKRQRYSSGYPLDFEGWCVKNKDKIIKYIDDEIKDLQSGCEQETCPLSNTAEGRYKELQKLKEFIEGLEW